MSGEAMRQALNEILSQWDRGTLAQRILVTQDAEIGRPQKRSIDDGDDYEVLIHPETWSVLRRDVLTDIPPDSPAAAHARIFGLPVVIESATQNQVQEDKGQ